MPKPLSNDLRKRLIEAVEGGMSARAAGRRFSIPASTATALVKRWRETGSYEPMWMGGHRRSILEDIKDVLEDILDRHGDWTEQEIADYLEKEQNIKVHPVTAGRFARKLGYRYKKNAARLRTGS